MQKDTFETETSESSREEKPKNTSDESDDIKQPLLVDEDESQATADPSDPKTEEHETNVKASDDEEDNDKDSIPSTAELDKALEMTEEGAFDIHFLFVCIITLNILI